MRNAEIDKILAICDSVFGPDANNPPPPIVPVTADCDCEACTIWARAELVVLHEN